MVNDILPGPAATDHATHDPFGMISNPADLTFAETVRDQDYEDWLDELAAQLAADERDAHERYGHGDPA